MKNKFSACKIVNELMKCEIIKIKNIRMQMIEIRRIFADKNPCELAYSAKPVFHCFIPVQPWKRSE